MPENIFLDTSIKRTERDDFTTYLIEPHPDAVDWLEDATERIRTTEGIGADFFEMMEEEGHEASDFVTLTTLLDNIPDREVGRTTTKRVDALGQVMYKKLTDEHSLARIDQLAQICQLIPDSLFSNFNKYTHMEGVVHSIRKQVLDLMVADAKADDLSGISFYTNDKKAKELLAARGFTSFGTKGRENYLIFDTGIPTYSLSRRVNERLYAGDSPSVDYHVVRPGEEHFLNMVLEVGFPRFDGIQIVNSFADLLKGKNIDPKLSRMIQKYEESDARLQFTSVASVDVPIYQKLKKRRAYRDEKVAIIDRIRPQYRGEEQLTEDQETAFRKSATNKILGEMEKDAKSNHAVAIRCSTRRPQLTSMLEEAGFNKIGDHLYLKMLPRDHVRW